MGDEQTPVDLLSSAGTGPVWGMASNDLNATLLAWPPGHDVAEHTNAELDVLLVVLEGSGVVTVDREERALAPGHLLCSKREPAGDPVGAGGLRYLSVHRRRGPLQVAPMPPQL